ncbi:voltage-dependent calcium channel gamma-5 subunit [Galendromus occidentalis]|uniref:Voltage-dependent calcium channel gamma-5 subunit n=1 Tax=Galendromus occidentalis TaxID=34638 RepID=A0AAJ7PAN1_9ACAR|nr:voltage-dependent calcium channel gamma-5 subunit [Galendromus occidentalis]
MSRHTVRLLRLLTPLTALGSLVAQGVALFTDRWLQSEELMPNPRYNGTGDKEYLSKFTISGLWKICFNDPGEIAQKCVNIDYFPAEEYSPDPNDSTMAIPYAVNRASTFILVSALILCLGEVLCFLGHLLKRRRVLIFAAGICFIISGLMILVGMVIYISTFKAEVGAKLRPKSTFQGPLFMYRYGYSFLLAVTGLMSSELAGTFAIFLCIHRYRQELKKKGLDRKIDSFLQNNDAHVPHCRRHGSRFSYTGSTTGSVTSVHPGSHNLGGLGLMGVGVGGAGGYGAVVGAGFGRCHNHHHSSGSVHAQPQHRNNSIRKLQSSYSVEEQDFYQRRRSVSNVIPLSESLTDLSYYHRPISRSGTNFERAASRDLSRELSRDFTCTTVSTTLDTLRRTTPV